MDLFNRLLGALTYYSRTPQTIAVMKKFSEANGLAFPDATASHLAEDLLNVNISPVSLISKQRDVESDGLEQRCQSLDS